MRMCEVCQLEISDTDGTEYKLQVYQKNEMVFKRDMDIHSACFPKFNANLEAFIDTRAYRAEVK